MQITVDGQVVTDPDMILRYPLMLFAVHICNKSVIILILLHRFLYVSSYLPKLICISFGSPFSGRVLSWYIIASHGRSHLHHICFKCFMKMTTWYALQPGILAKLHINTFYPTVVQPSLLSRFNCFSSIFCEPMLFSHCHVCLLLLW